MLWLTTECAVIEAGNLTNSPLYLALTLCSLSYPISSLLTPSLYWRRRAKLAPSFLTFLPCGAVFYSRGLYATQAEGKP